MPNTRDTIQDFDHKSAQCADQTVATGLGGEVHQTVNSGRPTLTTQQGVPISDDQNSLKIGARGPTTLEDFHFREKIFHFDHEPIELKAVDEVAAENCTQIAAQLLHRLSKRSHLVAIDDKLRVCLINAGIDDRWEGKLPAMHGDLHELIGKARDLLARGRRRNYHLNWKQASAGQRRRKEYRCTLH